MRAIKGNSLRASSIGISVNARLVAVYTLAAFYAGVAGALLAQTTAFASLDVFSFERSADLLLVLIIGGTGYLYGGLIGAVIFKLMQDWIANLTPQYWQFWIGLVLVLIVLVGRDRFGSWTGGVRALAAGMLRRFTGGSAPVPVPPGQGALTMAPVLETVGLEKHFGGLTAVAGLSLKIEKGARHALIGPNGAGKTTVINLLTGVLRPSAGRILLEGAGHHVARILPAGAARPGAHLSDQPVVPRPHAAGNDRARDLGAHGAGRAMVAGGRQQPRGGR